MEPLPCHPLWYPLSNIHELLIYHLCTKNSSFLLQKLLSIFCKNQIGSYLQKSPIITDFQFLWGFLLTINPSEPPLALIYNNDSAKIITEAFRHTGH